MTKRELIEALEASPLADNETVTVGVTCYDDLGNGFCKVLPIVSVDTNTLELQAEEA